MSDDDAVDGAIAVIDMSIEREMERQRALGMNNRIPLLLFRHHQELLMRMNHRLFALRLHRRLMIDPDDRQMEEDHDELYSTFIPNYFWSFWGKRVVSNQSNPWSSTRYFDLLFDFSL